MPADHAALLALCDRLQACCEPQAPGFDEALAEFKAQVLAHLQAEDPDDSAGEQAEFSSFAQEVMSTAHFDRRELHRFAQLWTEGHLHAAAGGG